MRLSDILIKFEEVHITVDDNGVVSNWRPLTSTLRSLMQTSNFTLTEWIQYCNQNNIRLDTTSTPFTFDVLKTISTYGAREIGFKVERANAYINPDSLANSVGDDLRLSRAGTDYSKFVGNVLTTINGIVHPVVINQNGIYARNGNKTAQDVGVKDVSMINFKDLGGFKIQNFPISGMYKQQGGSVKLYDNCCFNMNYDVTGKVFGAVIDGYLHILDDVIEVVGQRQLRIDWRKVPLLKRAILANGNPPNRTSVRSVSRVSEAMVTSNEWINDIILSPFTFLVVFNWGDITKSSKELISKGLPGVYFYPEDVNGIMMTSVGEIYSYKKFKDRSSYDMVREKHTQINLPVGGSYHDSFDTRLGSKTQYGGDTTFAGGQGFTMDVVKEVLFHVLPNDF